MKSDYYVSRTHRGGQGVNCMVKTPRLCLASALLMIAVARPLAGQSVSDAELLAAYQSEWASLSAVAQVGGDCTASVDRIEQWFDEHEPALDSLYARSSGLVDRLTDEQATSVAAAQSPLANQILQLSRRCRRENRFRELTRRISRLLGFGS